jgi:hypothetical protein
MTAFDDATAGPHGEAAAGQASAEPGLARSAEIA